MLRVRERPPLRLSVLVQPPSGLSYRWGEDSGDAANVPNGLRFGTAMPGGFTDLSCVLERDPRLQYPDLAEYSNITVEGLGGARIAWQGRLEDLPDTGGSQANVTPQCVGWQSHLDDDDSAAIIYVDQSQTSWQAPPLARQIALIGATNNYQLGQSSIAVDPSNRQPALILEIDGSWASPYRPDEEVWYDAGDGGVIAKVYYSIDFPTTDPNWLEQVFLSADDAGSTVEASGNLASSGPVSGYFEPATPYRYAVLQHLYAATPAGADNATFQTYWRPAVYGPHGLPGYGSDPVGLLASDVIAHAVGTWAPKIGFTTGPDGTIQPSAFIIDQLAFRSPTTTSVIVKQAAQFEILDWAVWEGPLLYSNARGARGRNWLTRVGECQLQETGIQASRIFNGVVVQYTDITGVSQTVGPPGSGADSTDARLLDPDPLNPANEAGIRKWGLLTIGTSTPAGAVQIGTRYLEVQAEASTSGQASLVGHVQDSRGVLWPAWMVRAGDTLSVVDARDPSPRRIVSTSYDDTAKANTVQLDTPPDTMTALLARMAEVLGPLGLN